MILKKLLKKQPRLMFLKPLFQVLVVQIRTGFERFTRHGRSLRLHPLARDDQAHVARRSKRPGLFQVMLHSSNGLEKLA